MPVVTPTKFMIYTWPFCDIIDTSEEEKVPLVRNEREPSKHKPTEKTFRRNETMNKYIERVIEATKAKNSHEPEFLQTV